MNKKERYTNLLNSLTKSVFLLFPELTLLDSFIRVDVDYKHITDYHPKVSIYIDRVSMNISDGTVCFILKTINESTYMFSDLSYNEIKQMSIIDQMKVFRSKLNISVSDHRYTCLLNTQPKCKIDESLKKVNKVFNRFQSQVDRISAVKRKYIK
jgi:hypothetical protein